MDNGQSNARNLHFASFFFNIKETIVSSFFMAYLLKLGATNMHISIYEPLLAAVGIITLFIFSTYLDNSRKSFIRYAALDRIVFALLCIVLFFTNNPLIIILLYGIYAAPVALTSALSGNYMKDGIPREHWGRVFAHNRMILIIAGMVTLMTAGVVLDRFEYAFPTSYIVAFSIAAVLYLISYSFLYKIKVEVKIRHANIDRWHLLKHIDRNLFFIMLFQAVIYLAAPLWSIYHIRELQLTNFQFSMLAFVPSLSGFITLPIWGRLLDKFSSKRLYVLCMWLNVFIPIMYSLHTGYYYLLGCQVIIGVLSNGYDLVLQNNLMENAKHMKYDYVYMSNYQIYNNIIRIVFPPLGIFIYTQVGITAAFATIGVIRILMASVVAYGIIKDEQIHHIQTVNTALEEC